MPRSRERLVRRAVLHVGAAVPPALAGRRHRSKFLLGAAVTSAIAQGGGDGCRRDEHGQAGPIPTHARPGRGAEIARAVSPLVVARALVAPAGSTYHLSMRPPLSSLRASATPLRSALRYRRWVGAATLAAALGCGDGSGTDRDAGDVSSDAALADADTGDAAPATVALTLDLVTEPATADEVADVLAAWETRDTSAREVTVEASGSIALGAESMTFVVLAHTVGDLRHVGAVLVPESLSSPVSAPVLVYCHGGYTGEGGLPPFRIEDLASRLPDGPLRGELVYVIPAYRGERIEIDGVAYAGEGAPSIGDREVDDAMALLSAALAQVPQADPDRVAVLGESRGGLVALEMGARDPRVDLVLDAYGPTDFRIGLASSGVDDALFEAAVQQALAAPDDPATLLLRSIVPIDQVSQADDGALVISAAGRRALRENLARSAPLAYAAELPVTETHHGSLDGTAAVEYSRALAEAMAAAGRPSPGPSFTYFEYEGGDHDLATLPGAVERLGEAIERVLAP
jgi:acetyl esterase/lipase